MLIIRGSAGAVKSWWTPRIWRPLIWVHAAFKASPSFGVCHTCIRLESGIAENQRGKRDDLKVRFGGIFRADDVLRFLDEHRQQGTDFFTPEQLLRALSKLLEAQKVNRWIDREIEKHAAYDWLLEQLTHAVAKMDQAQLLSLALRISSCPVNQHKPAIWESIQERAVAMKNDLSPNTITRLVRALVPADNIFNNQMPALSRSFVTVVNEQALRACKDFSEDQLAWLVWSLSKLEALDRTLAQAVAEVLKTRLDKFSETSLSYAFMALTKSGLETSDAGFQEAVLSTYLENRKIRPLYCVMILEGCVLMSPSPPSAPLLARVWFKLGQSLGSASKSEEGWKLSRTVIQRFLTVFSKWNIDIHTTGRIGKLIIAETPGLLKKLNDGKKVSNLLESIRSAGVRFDEEGFSGALAHSLRAHGDRFSVDQIASMMLSMGKMGFTPDTEAIKISYERVTRCSKHLTAVGLDTFLEALVLLQLPAQDTLLDALRGRQDLSPHGIIRLLWITDATKFEYMARQMAKQAYQKRGRFSTREISGLFFVCASGGFRIPGYLGEPLVTKAIQQHKDFSAGDISGMLWAMVTTQAKIPGKLVDVLCARANDLAEHFDSKQISVFSWALATIGVKAKDDLQLEMLEKFCTQGKSTRFEDFDPNSISTFLWSLARLDYQPATEFVEIMTERAAATYKAMDGPQLVNVLWALRTLSGSVDPTLMRTISTRALISKPRLDPAQLATVIGSLPDSDIPSHLVHAVASAWVDNVDTSSPSTISLVLWNFASIGSPPDAPLTEALLERAVATCSDFELEDIKILLWSLATLKIEPRLDLLTRMCMQALTRTEHWTIEAVSPIVWALASYNVAPPTELLASLSTMITTNNAIDDDTMALLHGFFVFAQASEDPALISLCETNQAFILGCQQAFGRMNSRISV